MIYNKFVDLNFYKFIFRISKLDKYQILAIVFAIILLLIIIVFTSRTRIIKTYNKYMKIGNKVNITGKELAFLSKRNLELDNLEFALTDRKLGDAYSPKYHTLILSEEVCNTASLASLTIVSHELGHAVQHKNATPLYVLTQLVKSLTNLTNKLIIPTLFIGLFLYLLKVPNENVGYILLIISLSLFLLHILELIIIIPLEYDASRRALKYLKEYNYVTPSEYRKAKKLLGVAAQTYIAGLFDDLLLLNKKRKKR